MDFKTTDLRQRGEGNFGEGTVEPESFSIMIVNHLTVQTALPSRHPGPHTHKEWSGRCAHQQMLLPKWTTPLLSYSRDSDSLMWSLK